MYIGSRFRCKKGIENCFTYKNYYFVKELNDNVVWFISDDGNSYHFYIEKKKEHQKHNIFKHYFNES